MALIDVVLVAGFAFAAVLLGFFAIHRLALVIRYRKVRKDCPAGARRGGPWPTVTVQLPIYNEGAVAERIIAAACRLRYPRDRLEIQVLDDSTDGTRARVARAVGRARAKGIAIEHLHRTDRRGFKAGALAYGLERSRGEVVAVFDADFVPPRHFLLDTVPHLADPTVGMVQARWDHLNRDHSVFTRIQALLLDAHFEIEHVARNQSGHFFNFNGTAGVWRRTCIEDSGGWQHDTLTEDLDLSYRAQLRGWRFVYLDRVRVPAELPLNIGALKTQQHRWTKGAVQTCRKLLGRVWRSPIPLPVKIEASFHLMDHFASLVVFGLTVVVFPGLLLRQSHLPDGLGAFIGAWPLALGLLALAVFYGVTAHRTGTEGARVIVLIPLMMSLFAGLGVTLVRAVLEGLFGKDVTFVRTPKYYAIGRRVLAKSPDAVPIHPSVVLEVVLGVHHAVLAVVSAASGWPLLSAVYVLFAGGLFWVAVATLGGRRPAPLALRPAAAR